MIKRLEKSDDLMKVAKLIFKTDEKLFKFLFGNFEKAVKKIVRLVEKEKNIFSYNNIFAYYNEDKIIGILVMYDVEKIVKKGVINDFISVFSKIELIKLFFKSILLNPVINLKGIRGLYIQNICVDEEYRGRGIGTKLLNYCFEYARSKKYREIFLDVSINNRAKELYLRNGFKIIDMKKAILLDFKVYRMRKEIK
ncbi:MAG: GNAT family N-acetyltransferase [Thermosipho sp. (in: Bacteria)]|nr:GNAT family N-acetyltransferase [Thermosipho sp. (in: thermotogales)]